MEELKISRRSFIKAAAVTGVAATVFPPGQSPLKALASGVKPAPENVGPGLPDGVYKTVCRSCWGGCPVLAHLKNGRVVRVEGNPESRDSKGTMCAVGLSALQNIYHPDRLKYPLKRVGKRGEGKWQRISWDEALTTVSSKMLEIKDKYGPEFIVSGRGTGREVDGDVAFRIFDALGSPNRASPGLICAVVTYNLGETWGNSTITPRSDTLRLINSKLIVAQGSGFAHRCFAGKPAMLKSIVEDKKKLITIDPAFDNPLAGMADLWLPIRPGADLALLLSWLNVIIGEKLWDADSVEQWTNGPFLILSNPQKPERGGGEDPGPLLTEADLVAGGSKTRYQVWDEKSKSLKYWDATIGVLKWETADVKPALYGSFKVKLANGKEVECKTVWQLLWERVKDWTPEKAAEITWLKADKIREAARMYATIKPAYFAFGQKLDMQAGACQSRRAQAILDMITGNMAFDAGQAPPKGLVAMKLGARDMPPAVVLPMSQHKKRIGVDKYPMFGKPTIWGYEYIPWDVFLEAMEDGKPYRPKLFMPWCTTLLWAPDQKRTWEALKKFDFIVTPDLFMSPIAAMSDIVLPAAHWLEENVVQFPFPAPRSACLRRNVAGQLWEVKEDLQIAIDLAQKLGSDIAKTYPWKNTEEFVDYQLQGTGMTQAEMREKGVVQCPPTVFPSAPYKTGSLRAAPWFAEVLPKEDCFDDKKPGFPTPTGKFEIYSMLLKRWGYDAMPLHYVEPSESPYSTPDLAKDYPLILMSSRRMPTFFHGEHRQIPWCRTIFPAPLLDINPDTAAPLGIADGDWVWIETRRGKVRHMARLTNGVHPQVVQAYQHNYWYPEKPETPDNPKGLYDSNINVLMDASVCDPVTGASQHTGLLCKVYKAKEGAPEGVWTKPEQFEAWLPKSAGGE